MASAGPADSDLLELLRLHCQCQGFVLALNFRLVNQTPFLNSERHGIKTIPAPGYGLVARAEGPLLSRSDLTGGPAPEGSFSGLQHPVEFLLLHRAFRLGGVQQADLACNSVGIHQRKRDWEA